jgi:predicted dehydrogenase
MNRRDFMKSTVVAGATAAFARPADAAVAPGDRLTVGFIGCGARAHEHLDDVTSMSGVEVVAVADAYTGRAERARARTGGRAAIVGDYREILANPGIDAVFVVTPDHWHKTMVVEALAAGKDVYVEKPMSYSIEDGLAMVAAARKSDRIVQVGSQGVSGADLIKARELVKAGKIGEVVMVRAAYNRNSAGGAWLYPIPPDASPSTVNWDQFIGPAPKRPFDLERFFRWRCYWDYSGGVATDLFVHLVTWMNFVTDAKMPKGIMATGENYRFKKTHEVPDTVNALMLYPENFTANLVCTLDNARGSQSGLEVLGTDGSLLLRNGGGVTLRPESKHEDNRWVVRSWPEALERAYYADPKIQAVESPDTWAAQTTPGEEHWGIEGRDDTYMHIANFFECVRTRKQPYEDVVFGHRAAACAHMVNRSIREKRMIEWDFTADRTKD